LPIRRHSQLSRAQKQSRRRRNFDGVAIARQGRANRFRYKVSKPFHETDGLAVMASRNDVETNRQHSL
jgi:hypothetical protein